MPKEITYDQGVVQKRQDGSTSVPSGRSIVIESGGALTVESGGTLTVASGATFNVASTNELTSNLTLTGADLVFSGTTGQNEITLTDNLADALSIKIAGGADFFVFTTTDSAEAVTLAQDFSIIGGKDLIFVGATGENEIHLTDNLADALSVKVAGGDDLIVIGTTNDDESVLLGSAITQKIGFHGATPAAQRASADQAAVDTTGATNVEPYGFTTAAQANAIVTLVNELRAALVEKGIIKGAA